jgi:hypothetical protein
MLSPSSEEDSSPPLDIPMRHGRLATDSLEITLYCPFERHKARRFRSIDRDERERERDG